jgi:hypothetical protein
MNNVGIYQTPRLLKLILYIIARKVALTSFCTPGFQDAKSASTSRPRPKYNQVVYVSSDSTSSSPGRNALKRDSSDLSIAAEIPLPVTKKQRKAPIEEKENALSVSSRTNYNALPAQATPRLNGKERKYTDLSSVSSYTAISIVLYLTSSRKPWNRSTCF